MSAPIRLMVFQGYRPGYGFYNSFGTFGAVYRPFLKVGARGAAVEEAQNLLEEKLQESLYSPRGVFDEDMKRAVIKFQTMYGGVLAIDGTIGKNTWTALLGQDVTTTRPGGSVPQPPVATTDPAQPPSVPGTSGPGGTGPGRDDGDIAVGGSTGKDKTMLVAGVAVAAVLAVLLMRK